MPRIIIESGHAERHYWQDIWRYRELFYVLAWRDISVRYKQTAIGVVWALVQPLMLVVVGTFIGSMANFPTNGVPRPLWIFAATLPWQFFSASLTAGGQSLIANANLISKVYFPRMIVPGSAVVTAVVDALIMFVLFVGLMAWYHVVPTWRFVFLPLLGGLTFLTALGPGLLINALNVQYRDFRYVIPFVIQTGFYLSPVIYSSTDVSTRLAAKFPLLATLFPLNPMVGVIESFRWALLGGASPVSATNFACTLAVTAIMLVGGVWYFRRMERVFADVI